MLTKCANSLLATVYRSDAVALDAVGGAAVVSVPCPASSRAAAPPDARSAYVLSVSAAPVCDSVLSPDAW